MKIYLATSVSIRNDIIASNMIIKPEEADTIEYGKIYLFNTNWNLLKTITFPIEDGKISMNAIISYDKSINDYVLNVFKANASDEAPTNFELVKITNFLTDSPTFEYQTSFENMTTPMGTLTMSDDSSLISYVSSNTPTRVFTYLKVNNEYILANTLTDPIEYDADSFFGKSIGLSGDGNTLIVCSATEAYKLADGTKGGVLTYKKITTGSTITWKLIDKLTSVPEGLTTDDNLSSEINAAISNDGLLMAGIVIVYIDQKIHSFLTFYRRKNIDQKWVKTEEKEIPKPENNDYNNLTISLSFNEAKNILLLSRIYSTGDDLMSYIHEYEYTDEEGDYK